MSMDDNGNDSISVGSMLLDGHGDYYASDDERILRNATNTSSIDDEMLSDSESDSYDRECRGLAAHRMNESPDISEGEDEYSNAFTIAFLQQKRHLLKRAADFMKREDIYDASIAKTAMNLMSLEDPEIWIEAKQVLRILAGQSCGENKEGLVIPQHVLSSTQCVSTSRRSEPPLKKHKIDVSSVRHVPSGDYCPVHFVVSSDRTMDGVPATSLYTDGPWMADALRQMMEGRFSCTDSSSIQRSMLSRSSTWDLQLDPNLGICLTSEHSESNAGWMNLADALANTDVPQLLAQSIHPFSVVHANRSFFTESGLSPCNVFGHNVETVLHGPIVTGTSMTAIFDGGKPWTIRVQPVCSRDGSIATHVLIQLIRDDEQSPRRTANALFAKETFSKEYEGEPHPTSLVEACG